MHELSDLSCKMILAQPRSWVLLSSPAVVAPLPDIEGVELVAAGVVASEGKAIVVV
jgi:hypothetical protein